jgi:hypothetical protein
LGLPNGLRQFLHPKCPIPSGSLIPDTMQIRLLEEGALCTGPYRQVRINSVMDSKMA